MGDAPIESLLLAAEDLAKGWLLALLEHASLDDAPSIVTADLPRQGPRICEAVVRALADEDDLTRLEPGGALEPLAAEIGGLVGAQGSDSISRAVDALRGVVWSAVRMELPGADGDHVAALAERLALVTEVVRGAALRSPASGRGGGEIVYPLRPAARSAPTAAVQPEPAPAAEQPEATAAPGQDALWIGAVQDEIARAAEMNAPLSLLLVELVDANRVAAAETPTEATATFGRFAQALRAVVRRKDILALETDTRAWVIARDTGRVGAQALASRAASSVGEARHWRGAPMTISAGVAVLNEDGRDAVTLIEAAEEAKFAAAAAGVAVIHELPPEENGGTGPRLVS